MNRRDLLKASLAVGSAGALGRYWPRHAPPTHPLALSHDVLDTLHATATPTLIGCGCPTPSWHPHLFPAVWARLRAFDTITPNNALKWSAYRAHPADAHAIADFCREHGKRLRLHAPLWGCERANQGRVPRDKVLGYVEELAREFGDVAYAWDIVNEPIHWPYMLDMLPDMVALARELTPHAAICVNEYDAIRYLPGYADTCVLDRTLALAHEIGADTVGVQTHGNRWYTQRELRRTFNDIGAAGLDCHVTEAIFRSDGTPVAVGHADAHAHCGHWTEAAQALACRDLLAVARAHRTVTSMTFWTLTDAAGWSQMPQGGLLRVDMTAKPAWREVQ